ncbi:DUF2225 domain-containing protein [bacterium]|nr:DUF2225 domain-containing protein [bacterium]
MQNQATGLLVKPLVIPRLVQMLSLLNQESELLDQEQQPSIPETETPPVEEDSSVLRKVQLRCPICDISFEALRYKLEQFTVMNTDTDFCPLSQEAVQPELYSIAVCPQCLFAYYVGRFEQIVIARGSKL